jgi:hypothetical protein
MAFAPPDGAVDTLPEWPSPSVFPSGSPPQPKRPYSELRADSLHRFKLNQPKRYFLKHLEQLGLQGTVQSQEHVSTLPSQTVIFEGDPTSPV